MYILYAFQCEILHQTISCKVFLVPYKIMNLKNVKFCFYFSSQKCPLSPTQAIPIFKFLTSICSCVLCHIYYQYLSKSKLNLTHGNQHSQNSENGPKLARNSEARWKLFKNIKTEDSSFKREKSSLLVETPEERGKKRVNKNVVTKLCESNINTVVEEHFSSENTQTFWYCCQSTMIKTIEQSAIVKKVVLSEVSKLNDSVMNKSHMDQTQFSPEKRTLE